MTDSDEKQRALDATMENEAKSDFGPMVQISVKEYDKLKERQKFITDKSLIDYIDKIEFFVKELRKHIVRTDI
tara:strand:- start:92 stop:310 length:219 start_codon:yes stop_codon:yes gene_type:complete